MGDLRKKFSLLSVVLILTAVIISSLGLSFGIGYTVNSSSKIAPSTLSSDETLIKWVDWAIRLEGYPDEQVDGTNQILYIRDEGELAYFNYEITNGKKDYAGWTICLERDLNMGNLPSSLKDDEQQTLNITPLWTPIPVGRNGKNVNITLDGRGRDGVQHCIENLKIVNPIIKNETTTNIIDNVDENITGIGLFANMVGGAVQHLTLKNTSIVYQCSDTDVTIDEDTASKEVAIGVVAGLTEGTTLSNVQIEQPKVELLTNSFDGHNFYVGAAIGKMQERYYQIKVDDEEVWAIKPQISVLDAVNVCDGSIRINIVYGTGENTYGYLGGLAGANLSGRIINCKVKNLLIKPDLNNANGTFYAGGFAGYSTMLYDTYHDKEEDVDVIVDETFMVAGIINNILMSDVAVNTGTANLTVGLLAGKVVNNWLHTNVYIGANTAGYQMFGSVDNNTEIFDEKANAVNYICANNAAFGALTDLNKFSDFNTGYLADIGAWIVEYDYALVENKTNQEKLRDAVNSFCLWKIDMSTGEPYFGNALSTDYDVTFVGNGGVWYNQNYYDYYDELYPIWGENYLSYIGSETYPQRVWKYKYLETVQAPEKLYFPVREGYRLVGWYTNIELTEPFCTISEDGTITASRSLVMSDHPETLYAKWQVIPYKVTFKVYEETVREEMVDFGTPITNPTTNAQNPLVMTAPRGRRFIGADNGGNLEVFWYENNWVTEEDDESLWPCGQTGRMMPAHDIVLYAGTTNLYDDLQKIYDEYAAYLNDCDYYTPESFALFSKIYDDAYDVIYNDADYSDTFLNKFKHSIVDLRIKIEELANMPQLTNPKLLPNKYPFLYVKKYYDDYLAAKIAARDFIDKFNDALVRIADYYENDNTDEDVIGSDLSLVRNVMSLKSNIDALNTTYDALSEHGNPQLIGADEDALLEVEFAYELLQSSITKYSQPDVDKEYTPETWVDMDLALKGWDSTFNKKDSPTLVAMQTAIERFMAAEGGLKEREKDVENNNGEDGDKKKKDDLIYLPMPPIVLGLLIAGGLMLIGGGFVGVDLLIKKSKAKVAQAKQAKPTTKNKMTTNVPEFDHDDTDTYV